MMIRQGNVFHRPASRTRLIRLMSTRRALIGNRRRTSHAGAAPNASGCSQSARHYLWKRAVLPPLANADHLDQLLAERFATITGLTVSVWWQLRAELDLRFWLAGLAARGARGALPLVVTRAAPLMFRAWTTDTLMERGFWNISVPAVRPYITLDITLAPSWAGTQPVTALDMAADISTAHLPRLHRSLWPSA